MGTFLSISDRIIHTKRLSLTWVKRLTLVRASLVNGQHGNGASYFITLVFVGHLYQG
jgi:hypothetical protein